MGSRRGSRKDAALEWPRLAPADERRVGAEDRIEWTTADDVIRPANPPRSGPASPRRRPTPAVAEPDPTGGGDAVLGELAALRALVVDLRAEIAELRAENAQMRRQLDARPPAAPRPGRPRRISVSRRS